MIPGLGVTAKRQLLRLGLLAAPGPNSARLGTGATMQWFCCLPKKSWLIVPTRS
jgi:hypothetical protein